ncbi:MAG: response regulator [Bacillota bacterium]
MNFTFFIIEDDLACRRILAQIIEDEFLGEVIGELGDGRGNVAGIILDCQPDILLVDLLMPGKDGIEIVEQLRDRDYNGKIVMISQVEKKEMVAQAYDAGIEFYIYKPINRVEVISVIKGLTDRLRMERSFEQMRNSLEAFDNIDGVKPSSLNGEGQSLDQETVKNQTREVLADLGLIGEPGSNDLVQIIVFLNSVNGAEKYLEESGRLKELYRIVQEEYIEEESRRSDIRTIEQRVRRAAKQAMDHITALGIEDYNDPIFERYAPKYFDFNELRLRMKELEQDSSAPTRTRVNIKQFINALYWDIKKSELKRRG